MLKLVCKFALAVSAFAVCGEEPKAAPTPPSNSPVTPVATNAPIAARPIAPMMNIPRPPNQEWMTLLDRLRIQPRAGEINNGTVTASLAEIFSDSAEAKTKSTALSAEYEKALLEKAAMWESDIKELRAQYETKMLAELPETKRDAAQKLLDMSRTKCTDATTRDTKTRTDFLERMRSARPQQPQGFRPGMPNAQGTTVAQPAADSNAWMRDERMKAMKQDEESVKAMRELLSPEDAARFDAHNRSRPGMTSAPVAKSAIPTAAPQMAPTVAPSTPSPVPVK